MLRFARIIAAEGYGRGLQPVQWQALTYLAAANRVSRTAKALTAWLGQTKGSVSQTISALEHKGLVSRRQDPGDQRVFRLALTDEGRAMLNAPPPSVIAQMLPQLSDGERDTFMALVAKMLVGSIARQGGRPFGQCRACKHFLMATEPEGSHRCALLDVFLSDEDSLSICYEQMPA
ncbi:MarR family winged helix-turn-helix transcriptional regulator [Hephaestia caeni]|uniref:MarR family winged helix-turn-helix transcriptional regulator n=1 Tax=Hephaestia caeni TaxID=645617 RepID=UPI001474E77C|nr:MarR family winged helix-turn-helix transcriptional regulator [Hephaestia caeni]